MDQWERFIRIFSKEIRTILKRTAAEFCGIQEIRLRTGRPLLIIFKNQEYGITPEGDLSTRLERAYRTGRQDVKETLENIAGHSLYAYEEEIRQGFITIPGGHRVGLAGKAVAEDGAVRAMKFISFLNIRLAHERKGCAGQVMPYLYGRDGMYHTLVISPPGCGKTTLLRDMVRQASEGFGGRPGMTVGVVDERSELAACWQGIPQNDLGLRTDVLDCCPKAQGMMMLIRTMSPQVVAVDEIGSGADLEAMEQVMNCGCRLMATVHGSSVEDVRRKPVLKHMLAQGWFERYIVLKKSPGPGALAGIFDQEGKPVYLSGEENRERRVEAWERRAEARERRVEAREREAKTRECGTEARERGREALAWRSG